MNAEIANILVVMGYAMACSLRPQEEPMMLRYDSYAASYSSHLMHESAWVTCEQRNLTDGAGTGLSVWWDVQSIVPSLYLFTVSEKMLFTRR